MVKKFICLTALCLALSVAGPVGAEQPGKVLFEYWLNITGTAVSNLTGAAAYPVAADKFEFRDSFKGAVNYANNFGTRARAYLTPPETGMYTFWIASDDSSHLFLSSDDNPANIRLIAQVSGYSGADVWTKFVQQKSDPVFLQAGQRYCLEARHKDGTGGDNLSVGWAGPGIGDTTTVIAGTYLTAPEPTFPAWKPDPADGATEVTSALFQWTAGKTAVSHDVYVGTNPTLGPGDSMGPWPTNMYFHLAGLTPGATYYWRVDEVDAAGAKYEGPVWSFTVAPMEAHNPTPADGAPWRALDTQLKWLAGQGAAQHKVFFGTDQALVTARDASVLVAGQPDATFTPVGLAGSTTYYWCVDEVDSTGKVVNGPVWSFSTIDPAGGLLAEYWNDINLVNNRNIALAGAPAVTTTVPSVDFSWPSGTVPGTNSPDPAVNVDNFAARFTGLLTVPVSGKYRLYLGSDDGGRLLLDGVTIAGVWGTRSETENGSAELDLVTDRQYLVVMEMFDATGGSAARLRWSGPGLAKEIIPPGALQVPHCALAPSPANGAVEVPQNAVMSFTPAAGALAHTVYFGTDKTKVTNGDSSVAQAPSAEAKYVPASALKFNTTYYWKVEEVTASGQTVAGPVWSFKTADWIVVQPGQIAGIPFSATLDYDNTQAPFMSQLVFDVPANLTANSVTDLVLRCQGQLAAGNSVYNDANQSYAVTGAGSDMWAAADQFQFVYKTLNGDGQIVARVTSFGTGTDPWAKGGVMIRQNLTAGSANAFGGLSAGSGDGATFQWRLAQDATPSDSSRTLKGIAPPYWVRVTRKGNLFTCELSADGQTWEQQGAAPKVPVEIAMTDPVYVGLAVTSHVNSATLRTFTFDNVSTTGDVTPAGPFRETETIGYVHNDPAPLYVAIEDQAGQMAMVTDPTAVNSAILGLCRFPMSGFTGVDLKKAAKLYIGVGDGQPGGVGSITLADVRIIKPIVGVPDPNAVDVTIKGDPVAGFPNDGYNVSGNTAGWPLANYPANVIDDAAGTKFLHFQGDVEAAGFCVTPSLGYTAVSGLAFTTGNDHAERDPITWQLYGSNVSLDGPWQELVASGTIDDFTRPQDWPRGAKTVTPIGFSRPNGMAFAHYKVVFPTVKQQANGLPYVADSMQIAEVELLGVPALVAPLADPIITAVVRSSTRSGAQDPIGSFDGSTQCLPMGLGGLKTGNRAYSDRLFSWSQVPPELVGAEYVRVFNDDKNVDTATYTVTFSRAVTVFVANDDRTTPAQTKVDAVVAKFAPAGTFKDTGLDACVYESASNPARKLSVFTADLPAGTYVFSPQKSGNNIYVIGALEKK